MAPPPIKELIKEPFGPYPDYAILNPSWIPTGTKLPQLRCLRLRQDGQFIGLDTCERYLEPPAKPSSPVSFFGVLIIEKLEWLSEAGKTFLKRDLNERDETWLGKRMSQNSLKSHQPRRLTLEGLYSQPPAGGFRIKVWVLCEKETPAMFLTATDYPESLLLNSKDKHRHYEILSMDRPTYFLSSNFLERYRLVALIKQIMDNTQYNLTPNSAEVNDLVSAYLLKHKGERLSHAVIFAKDGEAPVNPLLRHVSRAEVRGIFAAHSGWLLAFYLLKKQRANCPINIRAWCEFIFKVRAAKRARKSGTWSQTYEDDDIWASDDETSYKAISQTLVKFGGTADSWEKKLTNAVTQRNIHPLRLFDDDVPTVRSSKRRELSYDSDFSAPSTPGCSDSEYESDSPSPPTPHIILHMSKPPTLLPGRFMWDCPIRQCEYSIDFLNLEKAPDEGLSEAYIRKKQFDNSNDEHIQKVLRRRVSTHYCKVHLDISGTKIYENTEEFVSELLKKWY
ncbi:hypothetical protein B0H13DRAFT_1937271 [Mycena leptocephala]|nr:hypothetical protein B0H13DRAFT_1937271 [Mycena leptocephala]